MKSRDTGRMAWIEGRKFESYDENGGLRVDGRNVETRDDELGVVGLC